ncbi:MAG: DUF4287 domain-containing protein [Acidobacteriota bacterium]|nr:DUF4287 domain-containing protein [Acidobacteriota bacterium]
MPKQQRYDPHPGVVMVRDWIDTLKDKTGRSLDAWVDLVKEKGPKTTQERKAWLKSDHGLGTNSAGWIVDHAEGKPDLEEGDPAVYVRRAAEYVEAMFSGSKAPLRPIYDRLYTLARSVGKDIKVSPGKTIVSIYRNHVIAQIKPSTRTRIDFGFALKDTPAKGRLVETGGLAKGDRITHRIEITSPDQIDDTVEKWLRKAYAMDA